MEPATARSNNVIKIIVAITIVILLAGLIGWTVGRSSKPETTTSSTQSSTPAPPPAEKNPAAEAQVASLVSYTLPDGWKQDTCPSSVGAVHIVPSGGTLDCSNNPSSPIKLSADTENITDCNQLQNVQNVSKHICSSVFINGKKTIKAFTQYNKESSYKTDTSIARYYFDSGKGIVKAEHLYTTSNDFEAGFDQLVNSFQAK